MKHDRIIRHVLLDETHELSWWGRWRLRRELRRNPDASRIRDSVHSLQSGAQTISAPSGPAPHVLARIREEAAAHLTRRERLEDRLAPEPFARLWRPALLYGSLSLLLLIAGAFYFLAPEGDPYRAERPAPALYADTLWPEALDRPFAEFEDILTDLERDMELVQRSEKELWKELDELAEELMRLEEQQI